VAYTYLLYIIPIVISTVQLFEALKMENRGSPIHCNACNAKFCNALSSIIRYQ